MDYPLPQGTATTVWRPVRDPSKRWHYPGCTQDLVVLEGVLRFLDHGDFIVDPMCGSGTAGILLARHGFRSLGVDISRTAVRQARGRASQEGVPKLVDFVVGDARSLPVTTESVDFIFFHPPYFDLMDYSELNRNRTSGDLSTCESYSEFLKEVELVVRELFRIMRPGAGCCVQVGDTLSRGVYRPLGHDFYNTFRGKGFSLFEENVKLPPPEAYGRDGLSTKWRQRQRFLRETQRRNLIQHDYVMIFFKPWGSRQGQSYGPALEVDQKPFKARLPPAVSEDPLAEAA